jgi:hypothetical protein
MGDVIVAIRPLTVADIATLDIVTLCQLIHKDHVLSMVPRLALVYEFDH